MSGSPQFEPEKDANHFITKLPAKQLQTLLWNAPQKIFPHNTIWWLLGGYMKLVKW